MRSFDSKQVSEHTSRADCLIRFVSIQFIIYEYSHSITHQKAVLTRQIHTDETKNKFAWINGLVFN